MDRHQQYEESKSILLLNNRGARFLERGDGSAALAELLEAFHKAKALFRAAAAAGAAATAAYGDRTEGCPPAHPHDERWSALLDHLLVEHQQHQPEEHSSPPAAHQEPHQVFLTPDIIMSTEAEAEGRNDHSLESSCSPGRGFLYRRAIQLPEIPAELVVCSSAKESILSVVLFNLALAHQEAGTSLAGKTLPPTNYPEAPAGDFSPKLWLMKAVQLYKLALQVQQNQRRRNRPQQNHLYHMIVLNNLGQIYRLLGHETTADRCFQQLLPMTMCSMVNNQEGLQHPSGTFSDTSWPSQSRIASDANGSCNAARSRRRRILEGLILSTSYLIVKDANNQASAA